MNIKDQIFARMQADPTLDFSDAWKACITPPVQSSAEVDRRAREERERVQNYRDPAAEGALRLMARFPHVPADEAFICAREVQERGGNGTYFDQALARLLQDKVPTHQALMRARAAIESKGVERPARMTVNAATLKLRELDPTLSFDDAVALALRMNSRRGLEAGMAEAILLKKAEPNASLHVLLRS
jgi:hypothetical protein